MEGQRKHLYVLLDCSGSMLGQEAEVVLGVNSVLDATFAMQETPEEVYVEVHTFNTQSTILFPLSVLAKETPRLRKNDLCMKDDTALYDTLGTVLAKCEAGTTVLVATDGKDTASKEYTADGVRGLIESCKRDKDVRFVFVAAGGDAYQEASKIGLCEHECTQVEADDTLGTAMCSQPVLESLSQALFDDASSARKKRVKVDEPKIFSQDYE